VAAHWNELSPVLRFSLVLFLVGIFHVGGALLANRFPPLSTTLHALGTAALGAGIFLTAQIFNLHENWATGVLLWAIGAAAGFVLLGDWTQAAALAVLAPAWLISEWSVTTEWHSGGDRPLEVGLILIAICYLSARVGDQASRSRRTLVWIGGIALLPCVGTAIAMAFSDRYAFFPVQQPPVAISALVICWVVVVAGPLVLAWFLRGRSAWVNVVWAVWAYFLLLSASYSASVGRNEYHRSLGVTLALYALCAIGSVGLVAWGLNEKRKGATESGHRRVCNLRALLLFRQLHGEAGTLGEPARSWIALPGGGLRPGSHPTQADGADGEEPVNAMNKGILLGAIQIVVVLSLGAKLLYDRVTRPRAWVLCEVYDPDLPIRGRYLSERLRMPAEGFAYRESNPPNSSDWLINNQWAYLEVRDGQLIAKPQGSGSAQWVYLHKDHDGTIVAIGQEPVLLFIPERADIPSLRTGQQMWVEVTVPAKGRRVRSALALRKTESSRR